MTEENVVDLTSEMITCELCQKRFHEENFYKHLSTHSKEEVEALRKIAERKLRMSSEEEQQFNMEIVRGFYHLEQEGKEKKSDKDE